MRGTEEHTAIPLLVAWITPACAGNRGRNRPYRPAGEDHPRVCGEQEEKNSVCLRMSGSPPRVRGTDAAATHGLRRDRITPACAGNSTALGVAVAGVRDHPRVCGEQPRAAAAETVLSGSPPRVRGTAFQTLGFQRFLRITPACAGNRIIDGVEYPLGEDHPRVCGEQHRLLKKSSEFIGSPPRVRGTGAPLAAGHRKSRITPACAGNSALR